MRRRFHPVAAAIVAWILCLGLLGVPGTGQEATPEDQASNDEGPLQIVEVLIEPAQPGPDTLCTLTVRLRNRGERPASAFAFDVQIGGHSLPVYEKQIFMALVPPSPGTGPETGVDSAETTHDLRLFNFWTSDSMRPAPIDGDLDVRVRMVDAEWVEVRVEDDGTEVWGLDGPVPGLPQEVAVTIPLAKTP